MAESRPLRLTDLRKLRHATQVARSGSFTAASAALGITQSALTKSVAEVEHLLGIKLFQRLPRGVELTEAGRAFMPRAEQILRDTADLMNDLDQYQSLAAGHLRLGVAPAAYQSFLESTVSAFAKVYPGVSIEVVAGALPEMADAAYAGRVDLVVGAANFLTAFKSLQVEVVAPLHSSVIARGDHPLTEILEPTAKQVLTYPVVLPATGATTDAQLVQAYIHAGLEPRAPRYICDHFPLMLRLVRETDAILPIVSLATPGHRFRDEFAVYEGVIEVGTYQLGVAFSRARDLSVPAAAFADIFRSFLVDSTAG